MATLFVSAKVKNYLNASSDKGKQSIVFVGKEGNVFSEVKVALTMSIQKIEKYSKSIRGDVAEKKSFKENENLSIYFVGCFSYLDVDIIAMLVDEWKALKQMKADFILKKSGDIFNISADMADIKEGTLTQIIEALDS